MKTTPVESFQMDTRSGVNLLGRCAAVGIRRVLEDSSDDAAKGRGRLLEGHRDGTLRRGSGDVGGVGRDRRRRGRRRGGRRHPCRRRGGEVVRRPVEVGAIRAVEPAEFGRALLGGHPPHRRRVDPDVGEEDHLEAVRCLRVLAHPAVGGRLVGLDLSDGALEARDALGEVAGVGRDAGDDHARGEASPLLEHTAARVAATLAARGAGGASRGPDGCRDRRGRAEGRDDDRGCCLLLAQERQRFAELPLRRARAHLVRDSHLLRLGRGGAGLGEKGGGDEQGEQNAHLDEPLCS